MSAPDSPMQWFALACLIFACCLAATALSGWAEEYLRGLFGRAEVPYDDAELAEMVAAEEQAWAEWDGILRAVDDTPHDEPTPIFTRAVLDDIYRRTGGGAA